MADTAVLVIDMMNSYRHSDAVAHIDAELGDAALKMMAANMGALVMNTAEELD